MRCTYDADAQVAVVRMSGRLDLATAPALVATACRTWRLPDRVATAELVVAELVANAVQHAATTVGLTVSRSAGTLHLAVRDYSPEPARLTGPTGEGEPGGRGLIPVDALATHWGCTPTADGKVTWATLRRA